ncbi:MAG: glycoside hydrolase family 15 protein [Fimbriimonadaceae bacterium]|nr:glycoside hydrolase family 15 protein [Fimbriimonadaceae bacterium]
MPRDLVFGNGSMYVAMDRRGLIRELCWPTVGAPNHLAGRKIRLGIWRDGWFSWLEGDGWTVNQWYESSYGITQWAGFGYVIRRKACLDYETPYFEQKFEITGPDGEVLIYQAHDLRIGETDIGDACYYHSEPECILHYKLGVTVGFFGEGSTGWLDQYTCGMEGTWLDAEDGHLAGKPVEQGSVDSVFGIKVEIEGGRGDFSLPIICGETAEDVLETHKHGGAVPAVSEHSADSPLARISELVVSANTGNGGAVIAAIDSDIMGSNRSNYAYVWMRDAVLTARTMGGNDDLLAFIPRCDDGKFLWQKYHPAGYRGSSWHPWTGDNAFPYQMDETALLVTYGINNLDKSPSHEKDEARLTQWLKLLLKSVGPNGLPCQSWDLWEERFGIHFWTVATVIKAFKAGVELLGGQCQSAADQMVEAIQSQFLIENGRIPRRLYKENGEWIPDYTVDSAVLAGVLECPELQEQFLAPAVEMVEKYLTDQTEAGGVARYEGDYYCRVREGYPGNPWVICTMWLARAYLLQGRVTEYQKLIQWAEQRCSQSFMLAEQYHPDTGEPLSVSPLTWSHAEYLETIRFANEIKRA